MGSGDWYAAWSAAPTRPRPAPPWQPDETAVRRRVRQETAALLAATLVCTAVLVSRVRGDDPSQADPVVPAVWLVVGALNLARLHVPGWGDGYRRRLRDDVRVRQALRDHVDVGEAHRGSVSRRAWLRWWGIPLLVVGAPVAFGLLLRAGGDGGHGLALGLAGLVVVGYVAGLTVWPRQWREARRWLADPLPRQERGPGGDPG